MSSYKQDLQFIFYIGSENSELTVSDTTTVAETKLGEISYLSSEIQY